MCQLRRKSKVSEFFQGLARFAVTSFSKILKLGPHPIVRHVLSTLIGTTFFIQPTPATLALLTTFCIVLAQLLQLITTKLRFNPDSIDTVDQSFSPENKQIGLIRYLHVNYEKYKKQDVWYFLQAQMMSDFMAWWQICQQILVAYLSAINPLMTQVCLIVIIVSALVMTQKTRNSFYEDAFNSQHSLINKLNARISATHPQVQPINPVSAYEHLIFTISHLIIQFTALNLRTVTTLLKPVFFYCISASTSPVAIGILALGCFFAFNKNFLYKLAQGIISLICGVATTATAMHLIHHHLLMATNLLKYNSLLFFAIPALRAAAIVSGYCYSRSYYQYLRRSSVLADIAKQLPTSQAT